MVTPLIINGQNQDKYVRSTVIGANLHLQVNVNGVYVDSLVASGVDGYVTILGSGPISTVPLPDGYVYVGSPGNVAIAVPMTGDVTISGTGVTTVNNVVASNVSLGGNLTETVSSVLTITGGSAALLHGVTIQVQQAGPSTSGYLSSTDWNTFNSGSNVQSVSYSEIFIGSGS